MAVGMAPLMLVEGALFFEMMALGMSVSQLSLMPLVPWLLGAGPLLAIRWKVTHFELETDAEQLVMMINKSTDYHHSDLAPLIQDVVELINKKLTVVMSHVNREGNMVAHKLASYGANMVDT